MPVPVLRLKISMLNAADISCLKGRSTDEWGQCRCSSRWGEGRSPTFTFRALRSCCTPGQSSWPTMLWSKDRWSLLSVPMNTIFTRDLHPFRLSHYLRHNLIIKFHNTFFSNEGKLSSTSVPYLTSISYLCKLYFLLDLVTTLNWSHLLVIVYDNCLITDYCCYAIRHSLSTLFTYVMPATYGSLV